MDELAHVLRQQIRITRPGGIVSAAACFCHSDGLPPYHGNYPLPGNRRLDQLAHKRWQVYRRAVRPRLLAADLEEPNQALVSHFRQAGLDQIQINGHLVLISPGDARIPLEEAAAYALARHENERERLESIRRQHGHALDEAGFTHQEYEELLALKEARHAYLQQDPSRVRQVMEVYTDPLLFVRGRKQGNSLVR